MMVSLLRALLLEPVLETDGPDPAERGDS